MNEVMFTGLKYKDETPVPRTTYRCPATAKDPRKDGFTHLCKMVVDHPESGHLCVCSETWERLGHVHF